jgi:hypothetical protein
MTNHSILRGLRILAFTVIAGAAIGASAPSTAANHFAGGGYHGAPAFHGGYAVHPGFRGGYGYGGYRGYGYGYRGYGYRGGWGWWGWPGGLFLATLPLYYSTWYWNGVPYYYAYDNYYVWDGPAAQYEQVAPPQGLISGGAPAPAQGSADLYAYPKNGQSMEQQARDKQECRDWAAAQGGNGPPASAGAAGAIASATPQSGAVNLRAQAACLEGRGYSVK